MGDQRDPGTRDERLPGVWRDEHRLPLAELMRAVATSATDGQADDPSGNDAGIQEALDHAEAEPDDCDPDPDSCAGRRLRFDFTGPTGPD